MTHFASGPRLEKALIAHQLVPPHCRVMHVVIEAHAAVMIHYEVLVTGDDLRRFAAAITETLREEADEETHGKEP
jgi:hypothetical protein